MTERGETKQQRIPRREAPKERDPGCESRAFHPLFGFPALSLAFAIESLKAAFSELQTSPSWMADGAVRTVLLLPPPLADRLITVSYVKKPKRPPPLHCMESVSCVMHAR